MPDDDYAPWSKPRRSSSRMVVVTMAALLIGGVALAIVLVSSQRPELSAAAPDEPSVKPAPRGEEMLPALPKPPDQPKAAAEPTSATGESTQESPPPAPANGLVQVVIKTTPPKARFYRNGKLEGMSPLTVDVPAGEKLQFEVAHDCCYTRKLVVDGSEQQMSVAMRPRPETAPSE